MAVVLLDCEGRMANCNCPLIRFFSQPAVWGTALVLTLCVAVGVFATGMAPEPDPIPRRWQLTVEPGPLRIMNVETEGKGNVPYFYFTYTVTNNTGGDLLFTPSFDLASEKGDVMRSGRDVPADVTKKVLDSLNNPLLQDQVSIVGLLLQGEDNAKDGLAVFPASDLKMSDLAIYGAGFSGETRTIEVRNPTSGAMDKVTLRKSLMIRYAMPGEIRGQGSQPFPVAEKRWIMR